jgi:hypothetical protein
LVAAASGVQAQVVAWLCFVVGVGVLAAGVVIGLKIAWGDVKTKAAAKVAHNVERAKAQIDLLESDAVERISTQALTEEDATAAAAATTSTASAAKSALDEIGSVIGSLPENLRFAGLLVLVGMVLIGVATIQFGGVALF